MTTAKAGDDSYRRKRPLAFWFYGQRAKDGFRAGINRAVRFDELDGGIKVFAGDFGKSGGDLRILRGQIIHGVAGHLLPAADPKRAEIAVAVENHQRFRRRRGDAGAPIHAPLLPQMTRQDTTKFDALRFAEKRVDWL